MNPKNLLAKLGLWKHVFHKYREVFQSPVGEEVLYDLIRRYHGLKSTFSPNPQQQAFNEGQRSVVLHILGMMGKNESEFPELTRKVIDHGRRQSQRQ